MELLAIFYLLVTLVAFPAIVLIIYSVYELGYGKRLAIMVVVILFDFMFTMYTIPYGLQLNLPDENYTYTAFHKKDELMHDMFGRLMKEADTFKIEIVSGWIYTGNPILTTSYASIHGMASIGIYGYHYIPKIIHLTTYKYDAYRAKNRITYFRQQLLRNEIEDQSDFLRQLDENIKIIEESEKPENFQTITLGGAAVTKFLERWDGVFMYRNVIELRKYHLHQHAICLQVWIAVITLPIVFILFLIYDRHTLNIYPHIRAGIRRYLRRL